nr:DUF6878 family protein [Azospirillum sp. INR13]
MCASNHDETIGGVPAAPPAEAEPALWQARAEAHGRLATEARTLNKDAVLAALAAAGLSIVTVTFDGYGDSGQIEAIHAQAGKTEMPLPDGTAEIVTPALGRLGPGAAAPAAGRGRRGADLRPAHRHPRRLGRRRRRVRRPRPRRFRAGGPPGIQRALYRQRLLRA